MSVQYAQCLQGIQVAHSYHTSALFAGIWGFMQKRPRCGMVPYVKRHEKRLLKTAESAVAIAQQTRKKYARRAANSEKRTADIQSALDGLRDAMAPIRSEIGKYAYFQVNDESEDVRDMVRSASASIQAERRKLWKMSRVG